MKKEDEFVVGPAKRLASGWLKTFVFEPLHFFENILDFEGDVMEAFAAPFQKMGDGRIGVARFEEFNFGIARAENNCAADHRSG